MSRDDPPKLPDPTPFERFQDLTRRLLAVPKKEADEVAEQQDDFRGKKRKKTTKPQSNDKPKE